jgi:hypothetical protein
VAITSKTYTFKKGEKFSLDDIYEIQGLGGGDWWKNVGDDLQEHRRSIDLEMSESLVCTKTIKITVTVEVKN